jgi:uncharacterized protein involved in exopolysaccharide biosynthesis
MNAIGQEHAPSSTPKAGLDGEASAHVAEELSLWDFIDPLVSSWVSIAVIALIGAGVAFTLASLRRPVYQATAVFRIVGDQVDAVRTETLRRLLENRTIAGELIREFGITSDPAWMFLGESKPAAADVFLENHVNLEQVPGTNLLRVRVRLENAELAAKVANAWVERGNALSHRISQQDVSAPDNAKTRLDEVDRRLATLKADLLTLGQKGALDVRTTLLELQTAIEYERVFLTYVELSTRYADARRRPAAQLDFVDPAMTPSAPAPPGAIGMAQLGGGFALLVGCLLVLGRHFLYRHRLK